MDTCRWAKTTWMRVFLVLYLDAESCYNVVNIAGCGLGCLYVLMAKDKVDSLYMNVCCTCQVAGRPLDLFGIFSESIDTKVKYLQRSMATVYLFIRPMCQ